MKRWALIAVGLVVAFYGAFKVIKRLDLNPKYEVGQALDNFDGVVVYYNGGVDNVEERDKRDGYNIGLRYQCVEFVKRYYFEHLEHRMPDSYGHAISFFDPLVADGERNQKRALLQYTNPSASRPAPSDLLVMDRSLLNWYGHVAIVAQVSDTEIEIIQQNPGPFTPPRERIGLTETDDGRWQVASSRVLGWLRLGASATRTGEPAPGYSP